MLSFMLIHCNIYILLIVFMMIKFRIKLSINRMIKYWLKFISLVNKFDNNNNNNNNNSYNSHHFITLIFSCVHFHVFGYDNILSKTFCFSSNTYLSQI